MGLSLRSKRRPTFTPAERAELVDQLLLERWSPPEPTLTELHLDLREATLERDRLQSAVRAAAEQLEQLERRHAAEMSKPGAEPWAATLRARIDQWAAPHRAQLADAEAALADLNSTIDWDVLLAGEKRFRAAVADLMKVHQATRTEQAAARVEAARVAFADARRAVDADPTPAELRRLLEVAAQREYELIASRRLLDAIDRKAKR
jgi:hypothetical protein